MHHGAISVPVGLLVIVLAVGCGGGGGGNGNGDGGNGGNGANGGNGGSGGAANHNPIIDSLTARPDKVWPEGETDVTCEASDDDDDPLTYNWSCTGGSFDGDGATVTWEAPATSDTYGITCEVTDGRGGRTTRTTTVDVGWARVEGIVKDVSDNAGVQGAGITIDGSTDTTDADGQFSVGGVGPGTHQVQVQPPGTYINVGGTTTVEVTQPASTRTLSDPIRVFDTVVGGPPPPPGI